MCFCFSLLVCGQVGAIHSHCLLSGMPQGTQAQKIDSDKSLRGNIALLVCVVFIHFSHDMACQRKIVLNKKKCVLCSIGNLCDYMCAHGRKNFLKTERDGYHRRYI